MANTSADPAVGTTTPTTVEVILALYDHIAEAINSSGLQMVTSAHSSLGDYGDAGYAGIPVIYLPKQNELLTAKLRLTFFKARWRLGEFVEVRAANCTLHPNNLDYCKYPIIESKETKQIRKYVPGKKGFIDIPNERDMPMFSFNIFDMSGKIDELGEWAISQAADWLLARHAFLT